jgi:hypothetical protein
MSIFNTENGAGYIGGWHIAGAGNGWIAGAGEQYYLPDIPDPNGGGRDFPTFPNPYPNTNEPSPNPSPPPSSPSPSPSPSPQQPTQQQPTQQQPTQQQQQQPGVIDLFSRLKGMLGGASYTPSAPVVLLSPPQPPAQAVNYSGVFIVAIIAGAIIAIYYLYKKK